MHEQRSPPDCARGAEKANYTVSLMLPGAGVNCTSFQTESGAFASVISGWGGIVSARDAALSLPPSTSSGDRTASAADPAAMQ